MYAWNPQVKRVAAVAWSFSDRPGTCQKQLDLIDKIVTKHAAANATKKSQNLLHFNKQTHPIHCTAISKATINMAETKNTQDNRTIKDQDKKRKRDDGDTHPSKKQKEFKGRSNDKKFNHKKNKNNKNKNKTGQGAKKSNENTKAYQQPEREEALDESVGKMNEQILADYFLQKTKSHNKDLTAVELSDMSVPGTFYDGTKIKFSFSVNTAH